MTTARYVRWFEALGIEDVPLVRGTRPEPAAAQDRSGGAAFRRTVRGEVAWRRGGFAP